MRRCMWVYPRASGGTGLASASPWSSVGLSPRERGNQARAELREHWPGSIPARAGEPAPAADVGSDGRVYPRASGGTGLAWNTSPSSYGLSPRERGNHIRHLRRESFRRSIPARAGEPPDTYSGRPHRRGLSPRERGNLKDDTPVGRLIRSIPARAGEPFRVPRRCAGDAVYPRASGGTGGLPKAPRRIDGLSPRERGNRVAAQSDSCWPRSIPARAGEPPPGRCSLP